MVKTTVVSSGWKTNHSGPRIVCLWVVVRSRCVNRPMRSRYCHSSFQLRLNHGCSGPILVVHCWGFSCWVTLSDILSSGYGMHAGPATGLESRQAAALGRSPGFFPVRPSERLSCDRHFHVVY